MNFSFYESQDFEKWEERYRTTLMNSLTGFKSAMLIGTTDLHKKTNLSIVTSCFHLGANPPLIGFVIRPHTVPRHTLENILETSSYTINHVTADFYQKAHQTSARYPKEVSEFDEVSLTPFYSEKIMAPYVKESPLSIGMKLIRTLTLEENEIVLVIGQIQEVRYQEGMIENDGFLNLEKTKAVCALGLDSYHETKALGRLSYAKPTHRS
ncbi:MAG: flavin reductase [Bacteriovoracaceae bacterium]|nr:flavin reductase [Bacteriovoracaceae bacterium]